MGPTTSRAQAARQWGIVLLCLGVTAASAVWIVRTQFRPPEINADIHLAIGRVMARETARLVNQTGQVVLISIEASGSPELKIQIEEFERVLKEFPGMTIAKRYELDTHGKESYRFGSGLSGRRFVRLVNKNKTADVLVSFIGAPDLDDSEAAQLEAKPRFIAEARSSDHIEKLFARGLIHAAIVSRFQFPSPIRGKPRTIEQWFDQRYQILRASNLEDLDRARGKDDD